MSDEEENFQPAKRQKLHRHLNFKQQIAQIYVDVYLGSDARRADPLPGFTSFFQEKLSHWQELNAAEDFIQVTPRLRSLSADMAMLVHNAGLIVDTILDRVRAEPAGVLSLEPLVDLLAWLARDLQEDFVPLLERVLAKLGEVVARGLHHNPSALQQIFSCVYTLTKTLARWLCLRFEDVLRWTRSLRLNRAAHVRSLAAGGPAFLLRHLHGRGKNRMLRHAVRLVIDETVADNANTTPEQLHASACLLAGSIRGPRNTLNSHADALLRLILASSAQPNKKEEVTLEENTAPAAASLSHSGSVEQIRYARLLERFVGQVLENVQSSTSTPLWVALVAEADSRLDAVENSSCSNKDEHGAQQQATATASCAAALDLVGLAAEWRGGSRVESYAPLQGLLQRALCSGRLLCGCAEKEAETTAKSVPGPHNITAQRSILRLARAILRGQGRPSPSSSSSDGGRLPVTTFAVLAAEWSADLLRHVDPGLLLAFLGSLAQVGPQAQLAFFDTLGAPLLERYGGDTMPEQDVFSATPLLELGDLAWGVTLDAVEAAAKLGRESEIVAVLAPSALHVLQQCRDDKKPGIHLDGAWAAIRIIGKLGEATEKETGLPGMIQESVEHFWDYVRRLDEETAAMKDVLDTTTDVEIEAHAAPVASCLTNDRESLTLLMAETGSVRARLHLTPAKLEECARASLEVAMRHPRNAAALSSAAEVLERSASAGGNPRLDIALLEDTLQGLGADVLASRCAMLRVAAHNLLGAFEQPAQTGVPLLRALGPLHAAHAVGEHLSHDGNAVLQRAAALAEHRVLPDRLAPAIAASLVGLLKVPFARLWVPAAEALGKVLRSYREAVWKLVIAELVATQNEMLYGVVDTGDKAEEVDEKEDEPEEQESSRTPWWYGPRKRSELFAEAVTGGMGGRLTDAPTRLQYLLAAFAGAGGGCVERQAKQWVPLFFAYVDAGTLPDERSMNEPASLDDADGEEAVIDAASAMPRRQIGQWRWRAGLREWLKMLGALNGIRGMHRSQDVLQQILQYIRREEGPVQAAALLTLKAFKPPSIVPYIPRLINFTDEKKISTEMAAFALGDGVNTTRPDDESPALAPEDRSEVIPLLISILFPKMKKKSAKLGNAEARRKILTYLAAAHPEELAPVLAFFLEPFENAFASRLPACTPPAGVKPIAPLPAWTWALGQVSGDLWNQVLDPGTLNEAPISVRLGLMGTLKDLLGSMGYCIQMYAPAVLSFALALLEGSRAETLAVKADDASASEDEQEEEEHDDEEQVVATRPTSRDRSQLRLLRRESFHLITRVLATFALGPSDLSFLWPRLMAEVEAMLPRMAGEASSGTRIAVGLELIEVLARGPGYKKPGVGADGAPFTAALLVDSSVDFVGQPEQDVLPPLITNPLFSLEDGHHTSTSTGSKLLASTIQCLRDGSPINREAALRVLEALAALPEDIQSVILHDHLEHALQSLQELVVAVWNRQSGRGTKVQAGTTNAERKSSTIKPETLAGRALGLLESVAQRVRTVDLATKLTKALLAVLSGSVRRMRPGQSKLVTRTLDVLTALWGSDLIVVLEDDAHRDACLVTLRATFAALAPLAGRLTAAHDGVALARTATAIATRLTPIDGASRALAADTFMELTCLSIEELGEPDFDRRTRCYLGLYGEKWENLAAGKDAAAPALIAARALADLRGESTELGLRAAATEALMNLVGALKETYAENVTVDENAELAALVGSDDESDLGQDDNAEESASEVTEMDEQSSRALNKNSGSKDLATSSSSSVETSRTPSATLISLARGTLYQELVRGLVRTDSATARADHLALLRSLALALPSFFPGIVTLAMPQDEEADFWLNIAHLQLHRRARAMLRLARTLREPEAAQKLTLGVLLGIVGPLLLSAVREGAGAKMIASTYSSPAMQTGAKAEADASRTANVADAAVVALGSLATALPWKPYASLLTQALRMLRAAARGSGHSDTPNVSARTERIAVRAACAVLDNFHFNVNKDVEGVLTRRVIPTLRRHIVVDGREGTLAGGGVRAPVALSVIRALKRLPDKAVKAAVPSILQSIANMLKDKQESTRNESRSALVALTAELGPDYLPFVIDVLLEACPERGLTAHVLGYTTHAVVEGLINATPQPPTSNPKKTEEGKEESGKKSLSHMLGHCLPKLLPIIEADLWGEVAEAKEATLFSRLYKEVRRSRAPELYGLLARTVNFEQHVHELLSIVHNHVVDAETTVGRARLNKLLAAFVPGVLKNPTADPRSLCVFVYATLDDGLAAEEAAASAVVADTGVGEDARFILRGKNVTDENALSVAERREPVLPRIDKAREGGKKKAAVQTSAASPHIELFVSTVLSLFLGALRKKRPDPQANDSAPLLDPFLPLLIRALNSRHGPSVRDALSVLCLLVQGNLPGLSAAGSKACKASLHILQTRCTGLGDPLAQDCLRFLAGLLTAGRAFQPTPGQVKALLGRVFQDMEESAVHTSSFTLLRAVLAKSAATEEIHALMLRVREVLIRTHREEARRASAACLLQYLVELPNEGKASSKILAEHVQFLLKNTAYEHESGRMAALEMLSTLLTKLSPARVRPWADTALLPLVTRMAADPVSSCRSKAAQVVSSLAAIAGTSWRARTLGFCQQWLEGADVRLHRAALQLAGLVIEADAEGLSGAANAVLSLAIKCILADNGSLSPSEDDDADEQSDKWKTVYHALVLVEKIQRVLPSLLDSGPADSWAAAAIAMEHHHQWVQRAAGRVLLAGLGHANSPDGVSRLILETSSEIETSSPAAFLVSRFVSQLENPGPVDDELAVQAVRAVVLLAPNMYEADEAAGRLPRLSWLKAEAGEGQNEERSEEDHDDDTDSDEQQSQVTGVSIQSTGVPHRSLASILQRVALLAENTAFDQRPKRMAALRCLAAVAARLGVERALPFMPTLLRPIVRASEMAESQKKKHDEAEVLVHEVGDHLRALVGAQRAVQAMAVARARIERGRAYRRTEQARKKLIDPAAAAQARASKRRRDKEAQARKVEAERRRRQASTRPAKKKARKNK